MKHLPACMLAAARRGYVSGFEIVPGDVIEDGGCVMRVEVIDRGDYRDGLMGLYGKNVQVGGGESTVCGRKERVLRHR